MALSVQGAHCPQDIILMGVRWSVADPLRARHVEALLAERGVPVDHAPMPRWEVQDSPLLAAALPRRTRSVWRSGRLDETSITGQGQWDSLSRAVEKTGQTMDVLLTEHRDEAAALRLLTKALRRHGVPEQSTIDGRAAHEAALQSYNAAHGTAIIMRPGTSLNHSVEQDQRGVQRVTRPMWGCKSFDAAQCTVAGVERMHMLRKKQMVMEAGAEGLTAAEQFSSLAASSPHRQGQLPHHDLLSKICDKTSPATRPCSWSNAMRTRTAPISRPRWTPWKPATRTSPFPRPSVGSGQNF